MNQDRASMISDEAIQKQFDDELEVLYLKEPSIQNILKCLENLRERKISKKELQAERNRLTAQLSRDRKKLETEFIKQQNI